MLYSVMVSNEKGGEGVGGSVVIVQGLSGHQSACGRWLLSVLHHLVLCFHFS